MSNLTVRYVSKGNEITLSKRYLHPHVHCSTIQDNQNIKCSNVH